MYDNSISKVKGKTIIIKRENIEKLLLLDILLARHLPQVNPLITVTMQMIRI